MSLLCVIVGIHLDEVLQVLGQLVDRINRRRGANGYTSPTIDASSGIHKELRRLIEVRLVFSRMNAVHRAHVDAFGVLSASVRNNIGHG
jgi:hypothetical protein